MYCIHFCKEWKLQSLKVLIGSIDKNGAVYDLSLMTLTGVELDFAFQVDIPGSEQSLVELGINSPDRKLQFRTVGNNLIG